MSGAHDHDDALGPGTDEEREAPRRHLGTFDVVLLRSVRAFRREWAAGFGEEVL